jgi:hypothetical protein
MYKKLGHCQISTNTGILCARSMVAEGVPSNLRKTATSDGGLHNLPEPPVNLPKPRLGDAKQVIESELESLPVP